MSKPSGEDLDYLTVDIACLDLKKLRAILVSTAGNHCDVWRTSRRPATGRRAKAYLEFVLKYPRAVHTPAEVRVLERHYKMLKRALGDMIPEAIFFITRIDGRPNVCVMARAVNVWFNIANPQFEEEAINLLREYPKARQQLARFVAAATQWRNADDARLIDLYGLDNLVMDTDRKIRYLDSFYVFFFEDMLDLPQEPGDSLAQRIEISRMRLAYLEELLAQAQAADADR